MSFLSRILKHFKLKKEKRILKNINNLSINELIEIVEDQKYTLELLDTCKKELLKHNNKEVEAKISDYWKKYIRNNLKTIILSQKLPISEFLKPQEIKRLIKKVRSKQVIDSEDYGRNNTFGDPTLF